jgi:hypothetical protein
LLARSTPRKLAGVLAGIAAWNNPEQQPSREKQQSAGIALNRTQHAGGQDTVKELRR